MGLALSLRSLEVGKGQQVGWVRKKHRPRADMWEHYIPSQGQEQKLEHQELEGDPSLGVERLCEGQEVE